MALPIRDGNQSLTTLSTILVSNSHIPAHTVVSFGAQGITDIATAVSGVELGPNTLNALENITVTLGQVTITGGLTDAQLRASAVTIGGVVTATISGTPSVTFGTAVITGSTSILNFPATQAVTFGEVVVTGSTSIIGTPSVTFTQASITFGLISGTVTASISNTVTIAGTVTLGVGTAQIGSVTASNLATVLATYETNAQENSFNTVAQISGQGYVSDSAKSHITNSITIGSLPPISGTVTAFGEDKVSGGFLPIPLSDSGEAVIVDIRAASTDLPISGTVTANVFGFDSMNGGQKPLKLDDEGALFLSSSQAIALATGTNRIGVVTIGAGTVTIGAGTAQIGSVTASISGTVPISISSVTVGNSVTIGSLPAISGAVTANVFGKDYDGTAVALPILTHESGVATRGIPIGFNDNGNGTFFIVGDSQPLPVAGASYDGGSLAIPLGNDGDAESPSIVVPIGFAGDGEFKRVAFDAGLPISGTVTVGNSVTIGSIPPIQWSNANGGNAPTTVNQNAPLPVQLYTGAVPSSVTIGATIANSVTIGSLPALVAGTAQIGSVTASISNSVTISSLPAISGTVTANAPSYNLNFTTVTAFTFASSGDSPVFEISGIQAGQVFAFDGRFHGSTDNVYSLQAGINSGGTLQNAVTVSTIDADTFISATTFGFISGKLLAQQNISRSSYQFKKLSGTAASSITAGVSLVNIPNYGFERNTPISGTVTANTFALQGTAVTTSNFTSTTPSTVLAGFNASREVLTIFNEGGGNLHICAGATCTTIAYQVRLSAGDYYEVPNHQTTITHSAVFATAGTARVTQVS